MTTDIIAVARDVRLGGYKCPAEDAPEHRRRLTEAGYRVSTQRCPDGLVLLTWTRQ